MNRPLPHHSAQEISPRPIDSALLREIALAAGADDVGFVSIDNPAMDDQRAEILAAFPFARTLISFVTKMNRENVRTPARSVANVEFHHAADESNEVARNITKSLEALGVRAAFPSMAFPMEMSNWPNRIWVIAHKPVAVAAGLGRMGVHRNVIHPKFGNFILLGTGDRSGDRGLFQTARFQSLSGMQTVCRRLSYQRHRSRRTLRLLRLLYA